MFLGIKKWRSIGVEKFKGFPDVYYLTHPNNIKLQEYTEKNLEENKIFNFNRVYFDYQENEVSFATAIIKTLKNWLEKTNDNHVIIMTDDIDYQYVEYFHFDWEYFMNNVPYDFDSIQLGFEDKLEVLPCFLHPVRDSHGYGMTLITRRYAQKLIKLHYYDGKYNFFHKISNLFWKSDDNFVSPHYFLNQCGKCYSIPMFPRNPIFARDKYFTPESFETHRKLYSIWWKKLRDTKTLEEFFCYFSTKDLYLDLKKNTTNESNLNSSLIYGLVGR